MISSILQTITQTYNGICWFISQALIWVNFDKANIIIPVVLVILPFLFSTNKFKTPMKDWRKKTAIAALPLFWLASAIWGSNHWHQDNMEWPAYVLWSLWLPILSFAAYGLWLMVHNAGYRWLTAVLWLINAWFVLVVSLCAAMAISGDWI